MAIMKRYTGSSWEEFDGEGIVVSDQTIDSGVATGDLVYYNTDDSEWQTCTSQYPAPVGMKADTNEITVKGLITGLSGLTTGSFYYMDSSGNLSLTESDVKVGYSISTTELILDIDNKGYNVLPPRGLFGGGQTYNTIDYVTISSTGNATDFGDLTVARYGLAGCSSSTRGLFAGGYSGAYTNILDYVTIMSEGNATDFGDLSQTVYYIGACSSSTRGLFAGGYSGTTGDPSQKIEYVTISTTGNTSNFGDLIGTEMWGIAGCSSSTRGLFGGDKQYLSKRIEYITMSSTGNATDFGDLTVARYGLAGCSSSTRGLFAGGSSTTNVIDYVTIASTGNATDFGDLTAARYDLAGCSSSTRGLFAGGSGYDIIDYVTIASTGNATDFGDLTVSRKVLAGCSNAHGGL